jgi:hypothetical protein
MIVGTASSCLYATIVMAGVGAAGTATRFIERRNAHDSGDSGKWSMGLFRVSLGVAAVIVAGAMSSRGPVGVS